MKTNDVIDSYVRDVMHRLPARDRNDIGLELRELLAEMLDDRGAGGGKDAEAATLAMLREFGTPADVAARYQPPGMLIIPARQTRQFAVWSLVGIALQWALTLPRVFEGQPVVAWWFSWGLGALWWPGFLVMMALAAAVVRRGGLSARAWRPRGGPTGKVHRPTAAVAFAWMLVGIAIVLCLPWIGPLLPGPFAHMFAIDDDFLRTRAWPVVLLYLGNTLVRAAVLYKGQWSPFLRRADLATNVLWVAVLAWWLAAGPIFVTPATNTGAKGGIALGVLVIIIDSAVKLRRSWRARIRMPRAAD